MELLDANSKYALIRHSNGIELTVSVRDLAPYPRTDTGESVSDGEGSLSEPSDGDDARSGSAEIPGTPLTADSSGSGAVGEHQDTDTVPLRRSGRARRAPQRYGQWTK